MRADSATLNRVPDSTASDLSRSERAGSGRSSTGPSVSCTKARSSAWLTLLISRYNPSPAKLVTAPLPASRWPTCNATLASSYSRGMSSGPAPIWLTPTE
jgi:hypothetical protein